MLHKYPKEDISASQSFSVTFSYKKRKIPSISSPYTLYSRSFSLGSIGMEIIHQCLDEVFLYVVDFFTKIEETFVTCMWCYILYPNRERNSLSFNCSTRDRNSGYTGKIDWYGKNITKIHRKWIAFLTYLICRCGCSRCHHQVNILKHMSELCTHH